MQHPCNPWVIRWSQLVPAAACGIDNFLTKRGSRRCGGTKGAHGDSLLAFLRPPLLFITLSLSQVA